MLVSIDEPPAGSSDRFGGTAAAPVFAELAPTIDPRAGHPAAARLDRLRGVTVTVPRDRAAATTLGALRSPCRRAVDAAASSATPTVAVDGDHPRLPPVPPGALFACLRGEHHDGHEFAAGGGRRRAPPRCSSTTRSTLDVAQIVVDDTRAAMGPLAAAVHGHPSRGADASSASPAPTARRRRRICSPRSCAPPGRPTGVIGTLSGVAHHARGARAAAPARRVPRRRRSRRW